MSAVQQNTAVAHRPVPGISPARKFTNSLMGGLIALGTLLVVAPLLLIFYYLLTLSLIHI